VGGNAPGSSASRYREAPKVSTRGGVSAAVREKSRADPKLIWELTVSAVSGSLAFSNNQPVKR